MKLDRLQDFEEMLFVMNDRALELDLREEFDEAAFSNLSSPVFVDMYRTYMQDLREAARKIFQQNIANGAWIDADTEALYHSLHDASQPIEPSTIEYLYGMPAPIEGEYDFGNWADDELYNGIYAYRVRAIAQALVSLLERDLPGSDGPGAGIRNHDVAEFLQAIRADDGDMTIKKWVNGIAEELIENV